jgi:hypothetical protein
MGMLRKKKEINPQLITATKSLYQTSRNYVRSKNNTSKERQGGVLSPLLFIIMIKDRIKKHKNLRNKRLKWYIILSKKAYKKLKDIKKAYKPKNKA